MIVTFLRDICNLTDFEDYVSWSICMQVGLWQKRPLTYLWCCFVCVPGWQKLRRRTVSVRQKVWTCMKSFDRDGEVDQGELSTIKLEMLESSGFRKYSTLLVIQLFSWRLCLCHCLCIRLCLCICVPYSFLNSYYHKLSENVWVLGCGATRSEIWTDVTIAGRTNEQTNKKER